MDEEIVHVDTLIVEIRPRIQAVSVFVRFENEYEGAADIRLSSNMFEIHIGGKLKRRFTFSEFSTILDSLSAITYSVTGVAFRFQTQNISPEYGSTKCELLTNDDLHRGAEQLQCFIKSDQVYTLKCGNCSTTFVNNLKFERILPLPEVPDPQDFFCHQYKDTILNLAPNLSDCFYGYCFCYINETYCADLKLEGKNLICRECDAALGTKLKTKACKIWFNTVTFIGFREHKTKPLDDAFIAIKRSLGNTLADTPKFILTCASMEDEVVLLWILDRKLKIAFEKHTQSFNGNVAKVLFRIEHNKSQLSKSWLDHFSTRTIDMSKLMLLSLVDHLKLFHNSFPKNFQIIDEFNVSYLMYNC